MVRTITFKELYLEELNRQLAPQGVQIISGCESDKPKPRLATHEGRVIQLHNPEEEND
jgi:hypothetical protein